MLKCKTMISTLRFADKALNGGGEVNKDAAKMMSTTQEQMKALQIRIQETSLELGKSLIPAFKR